MSFLQQLRAKRAQLQTTATIVTTATGERFIECKTAEGVLQQRQKLTNSTYGFVVDTKPDTVPASILEQFLYLGSQDAVNLENIRKLQLTHILSVGIDIPNIKELSPDVQVKYLPCLDLPETQLHSSGIFNEANAFIESVRRSSGRVLVHCNAGVSRSASVVISYLIYKKKINFDEAYALVKSKRKCVQPNAGFMQQLRALNFDQR